MWYSRARYVLTLRKKNIMCLPFAPHGNAWFTYFSYNKKLEHEMNFQSHIVKIENALKVWRMRNLKIERKVLVFTSLAISKIVHLALITTVPHAEIN